MKKKLQCLKYTFTCKKVKDWNVRNKLILVEKVTDWNTLFEVILHGLAFWLKSRNEKLFLICYFFHHALVPRI